MSMLDDMESTGGEATVEIPTGGSAVAIGEIKKRRGRPPGSKNKPRADDSLQVTLKSAIRGLFALCGLVAGWFGYEQTEDLTDSEAEDGARAFAPIAAKAPWFMTVAIYIGGPAWLVMTLRRKFTKREITHGSTSSSGSNGPVADASRTGPAPENDESEAVGDVPAWGQDYRPRAAIHGEVDAGGGDNERG